MIYDLTVIIWKCINTENSNIYFSKKTVKRIDWFIVMFSSYVSSRQLFGLSKIGISDISNHAINKSIIHISQIKLVMLQCLMTPFYMLSTLSTYVPWTYSNSCICSYWGPRSTTKLYKTRSTIRPYTAWSAYISLLPQILQQTQEYWLAFLWFLLCLLDTVIHQQVVMLHNC